MKKLKFLPLGVVLVFLSLMMFSCQKDWLSPPPENTLISTDSTFTDPQNAVNFVNACYGQLIDWQVSVFSWTGISSLTSDDADKGSAPGDTGTDKDQFDNLTYSPTSLSVGEVWNGYYAGVGRCNQALANIPNFKTLDANVAKRLIGETKFLRAFYYFNLVRVFGGVPKIDKVYGADELDAIANSNVRAKEEEIYALIIADLTDAANALPEKGVAETGRANKGSAQGLLAKVYMYQKNWAKCLENTSSMINSGTYSLNPDYRTIWRQSSENNSESIFEIQGQNGEDGWGIGGYFTHQGARGTVTDGYGGWGFNTPTADLEAAFEDGDIRKNTTIYRGGETLWDGAVVGTDVENPRYNYKAYVSKNGETNYDDWSSGKNIRVLRFAEILLIHAEASNETGKTGDAIAALDKVRNRAGLPNTTASSQAAVRDAIWKERRVELAMEHDRFFDLVRQGRAGQVLRAHGKPFVDGKHERFPVPLSQILISQGKLTQNPGY
jgi:starch-binding outer membrane protein, SusD/RagB family